MCVKLLKLQSTVEFKFFFHSEESLKKFKQAIVIKQYRLTNREHYETRQ